MSSVFLPQLRAALRDWWREQTSSKGVAGAAFLLVRELWGFALESTPAQRRQRYGDMDFDWEQHVNTTSGAVSWRTRLLGIFHSPYQPTDPALFREMMAALPIDFREFTFIDIGSGKGRTLLLASEYPFRRIVGVELLIELHSAAEENVAQHRLRLGTVTGGQEAQVIEALCIDAREFVFPETPLVVYLFNPLTEAGLRQVLHNLEQSCRRNPRSVWIVYHNPVLETVLCQKPTTMKELAGPEYSVFRMNADAA
ncbi:MAG: class I SAM-dependent methyltransferase [Terriglobales bacterium]